LLEGSQQNVKNRLTRDQISCSMSRAELRQFCGILQERAHTAVTHEFEHFKQGSQQSPEQFEADKTLLRQAFELRITVRGSTGQELYGTVAEVFDSPNFPDEVRTLYVNSATVLKALYNYVPRNSFEVLLDFSRPDVFDFTLMPSHRTPNNSNIIVEGFEATWVNGVFHECLTFLDGHAAPLATVHRHSVYDFLLWILGFPLGFWVCFKLAPLINASADMATGFVSAALYVYAFIATLFLFRALFHYARWVFPIMEYQHARSRVIAHRTLLGVLSTGLLISVAYDTLKWVVQ
jgi:hypothetical protein